MTLTVNGHLEDVALSRRELDVLAVIADLYSTEEAALILHITPNTVKTHLKTIYQKLTVGSRGEAVRRARSLGLM